MYQWNREMEVYMRVSCEVTDAHCVMLLATNISSIGYICLWLHSTPHVNVGSLRTRNQPQLTSSQRGHWIQYCACMKFVH